MKLPTATTIAGQRRQVWEGRADQTSSGLTKSDLKENKDGKIVSKKASKAAKKNAEPLKMWRKAVKDAAEELGVEPVVAPKRGTKLHKAAIKLYHNC